MYVYIYIYDIWYLIYDILHMRIVCTNTHTHTEILWIQTSGVRHGLVMNSLCMILTSGMIKVSNVFYSSRLKGSKRWADVLVISQIWPLPHWHGFDGKQRYGLWIEKKLRKTCFDISKVSHEGWGWTISTASRRGTWWKFSNTNNGCIMDKNIKQQEISGVLTGTCCRGTLTPACSFFVCPSNYLFLPYLLTCPCDPTGWAGCRVMWWYS